MRQAFIYLTLRCNNYCKMCYMNEHYSNKLDMDYEDVCELLCDLKGQGIEKVTFLGGEPTLYPKLYELLQYTKGLKLPFIRLQTNGQFDNDFLDNEVVKRCVDAFTFSLDGHTEELNQVMRIGSSFERVVSNIRKSLTLKKKIAVNTTISNSNIDYIFDIIDFLENMGVPNLYLNLMFDSNEVITEIAESNVFAQKWCNVRNEIANRYANSAIRIKMPIGFAGHTEKGNRCLAMNPDRVYIMPNMDRYPCILFVNEPKYLMDSNSWERPLIMQAYDESKCNDSCFYLRNKYNNTKPMCLYYKMNIGCNK